MCKSPILSAEGNMLDEVGNFKMLIEDSCMFNSNEPEEETKSTTTPLLTEKIGRNDYSTFLTIEESKKLDEIFD